MRHAQTQDIINDGTEKQQSSTLESHGVSAQPVVSPRDKLMQGIIYFSNTIYEGEGVYSNRYK